MKAEIMTIGDEILIGQIVDTNSAWMGQKLNEAGIDVVQISSVSDQESAIFEALAQAEKRAEVVLITGGLGPTKDDITKHTLTAYFDDVLVNHQPSLDNIERMFKAYGRTVNPVNVQQAMLPSKARIVVNKNGTAAGMWFQQNGKSVISMPGVPYEMKGMMSDEILPSIQQENNITIFQPERWAEIVDSRKQYGEEIKLSDELIMDLIKAIHREAIAIQTNILNNGK